MRHSHQRLTFCLVGLRGALFGLALMIIASPASAQTVVDAARAALPEATRASGVLKVATSLQWPPFAFAAPGGGPDGIDIRLVRLLAAKLGLRPGFDDIKFPSIVPGVAAGRYDIGVDQIGHTEERAKVAGFVDYYASGYGLLVRQGSASGLDVNHLCGRTLAVTQGSAQVAVAAQLSANCVKAGEAAIATLIFPDSADTYLAVANGRGDGFLADRRHGRVHRQDQRQAGDAGRHAARAVSRCPGSWSPRAIPRWPRRCAWRWRARSRTAATRSCWPSSACRTAH